MPGMPAEPGAVGNGHKSAAERAVSIQLSETRLAWQRLKNEEKERELQVQLGNLVAKDVFMRQVRAANATVRKTVLAVIERANLPYETRVRLKHDMMEILNELPFEQQHTDTGG